MALQRKSQGGSKPKHPAVDDVDAQSAMHAQEDTKGHETADEEDDEDDDEEGVPLNEGGSKLTKIHKIGIAAAAAVIVLVIVLIVAMSGSRQPPEPIVSPSIEPTLEPTPDTGQSTLEDIYQAGIGKDAIDEARLYDQGNLENFAFRKDFKGIDQPEMFVQPIKINYVREGIYYKKHRSIFGDGVEVYWVEGTFQGRPVTFTIPYGVYQFLAPEGTMEVNVEVVTDKNGSITVTSFTAIPPANK